MTHLSAEHLTELLERVTPGEWGAGHLWDDTTPCNCAYIFGDNNMGSIATVNWSPDDSIENGDNPPLDEAKANQVLIALAPALARRVIAAEKMAEALREIEGKDSYIDSTIRSDSPNGERPVIYGDFADIARAALSAWSEHV